MKTKQERITQKIEANKDIMRKINSFEYYTVENFYDDVLEYIQAIKESRMCCVIHKVSASGMSRNISFSSCNRNKRNKKHWYRNYTMLFKALGYNHPRNEDYQFQISGCGMNMIFHTNYTNMHRFKSLGFISKKQCERLAQETPTVL